MKNLEKEDYKRKIGEAIGEASMCWSETPRGIFNSERAGKIVDELVKIIEKEKEKSYLLGKDEKLASTYKSSESYLRGRQEYKDELISELTHRNVLCKRADIINLIKEK
jgi:hypothetical protein